MKKSPLILSAILGLSVSFNALASSDSWEKTRLGYSFYGEGEVSSTGFSGDANVPRYNTSITNVSWEWNPVHTAKSIEVQLCYIKQYNWKDYKCIDITYAQQGNNTEAFDGLSAKGKFYMRFMTFGGSYPIYSSDRVKDTVRVDYKY